MIRTFVAAQSALARAGLTAAVRSDVRLMLAGESSSDDLAEALAAVDPDVLLEVVSPNARGVAPPGVARPFDLPTVMLLDDPRDAWTHAAAAPDATPFALLAADAGQAEIVAAIVAVAAGLVAVAPATLGSGARTAPGSERLTPREIDVLGELARGIPNKTIAAHLAISEHTVKFHVASIFAKLGAASRTEAVAQGVRLGLIML